MKNNDYLKTLNEKQKEAVEHVYGPLFVAAGAGTGKTKTLTSRLAYLINEGYSAPENLLAVTFTNKAAKEMKERVARIVGDDAYRMWVFTFHAFGLRVLRANIERLGIEGLTRSFTVCDEDDATQIIREIIKEFSIDNKDMTPKRVRHLLSKYQNLEIESFSRNSVDEATYKMILAAYQARLMRDNLVDFDGLLLYTLRLLTEDKIVREYYQNQFKFVLVDEFQDTNQIQYDIIKILGLNHKNIFVVGDPDQSIYSFRGATYLNNEKFIKEFDAKVVVLDKNYRSTNSILKKANALIKHNRSRVTEKELVSDLGNGYQVMINRFANDLEETYFIAHEINELVDFGYEYNNIAVLYRNNSLSRIVEETFVRSKIPYVIFGGISFFQRREVKDILAYLRVALDFKQNFFLKRIINVPKRKIGLSTVEKLETESLKRNISYFDAIEYTDVSSGTKKSLADFKNVIEEIKIKLYDENNTIESIVDDILLLSGYKDYLLEEGEEGAERLENVLELKNIFARGAYYYEGNKIEKLTSILDEISLITDLESHMADENRVILSTVHQVKGLEFKVVFIVALEEGIFPNPNRFESESELEEDRRVAYVGVTRAKERLYLSSAKQRYRFGHVENLRESRFIMEMATDQKEKNKAVITESVGLLKAGDRVNHQVFGDGIVVQVKDKIATIAFSMPHGIKQIIEDHPSIRKI